MAMKKLHCVRFQAHMNFDEEIFKKNEFLSDIKKDDLSQNERIDIVFGSKNKDEHLHLFLGLNKKKSFFQLTYYQRKASSKDTREPYLEDCPKWFSAFFSKDSFESTINVAYRYDKAYESILKLQYPLLVENPLLEQATISGHQIELANNSLVERIFLSHVKDKVAIVLNGNLNINLEAFDVYSQIKALSSYSEGLIRKKS